MKKVELKIEQQIDTICQFEQNTREELIPSLQTKIENCKKQITELKEKKSGCEEQLNYLNGKTTTGCNTKEIRSLNRLITEFQSEIDNQQSEINISERRIEDYHESLEDIPQIIFELKNLE